MFRFHLTDGQHAALTSRYVWFNRGNSLFRRNLETLKEEFIYLFDLGIGSIWVHGDQIAVRQGIWQVWKYQDPGWSFVASSDGLRPSHTTDDYWVWNGTLSCKSRTAARLKRLSSAHPQLLNHA